MGSYFSLFITGYVIFPNAAMCSSLYRARPPYKCSMGLQQWQQYKVTGLCGKSDRGPNPGLPLQQSRELYIATFPVYVVH